MAKNEREERQEKRRKGGALFVPACLLIGIGVGFILSNIPAGTLIGLGIGFAIWAIISVVRK